MTHRNVTRVLAYALIAGLLLHFAPAAHALGKGKAEWTAQFMPADARAGEGGQIVVTAKIDSGWHIYAPTSPKDGPIATTIALSKDSKSLVAGKVVQPTPEKKHDAGFNIDVEVYSDTISFGLPVTVASSAKGAQKATIEIRYQACDDSTCMPPENVKIPITFTPAAGAARADHKKPITTLPKPAAPEKTEKEGGVAGLVSQPPSSGGPTPLEKQPLLPFLWLSILAGFSALLTPCVFPMIPITVSYFIKKKDAPETNKISVAGPLAYCLGIIGTFTGVGVVTAAIFGAGTIQRFANAPVTNIVLALLFTVLAANLFGVFEIVLPSALVNKASEGSQRGGLLGPFMMGLTFALTSFTCTVAFVGTLLVLASKGSFFYPVVGMLAFSTAFALPFFLLALFPGYLARLPKSGSWMVTVKAFMGFLELAAALKFLSNADLVLQKGWLTRPVFLAIWASLFVIAGAYLLGWLRLPHDAQNLKIGWGRRMLGVATACIGLFCFAGIGGVSLGQLDPYVPPTPYPGQEFASGTGVPFLHKLSWAQAIAKIENKPIFINFTGVNCTNCRQMEKYVLPLPDVAHELDNFIPVELYTDRETPEDNANKAFQEQLSGEVTLPLYVVVTPDGKTKLKSFPGFTRRPQDFVRFLKDAHASAGQIASR